jgi:hypothetical protein
MPSAHPVHRPGRRALAVRPALELQREFAERGEGCQSGRGQPAVPHALARAPDGAQADHGRLPPDNAKNPPPNLGRLSPS